MVDLPIVILLLIEMFPITKNREQFPNIRLKLLQNLISSHYEILQK